MMQLGLWTPIVVQVPSVRAEWEQGASIDQLTQIAQSADRFGYYYLTCSEHVAIAPGHWRGTMYWDPCATFSFLAARTERIRFLPFVLVIGFHHPLEIAKRFGTLDMLSGGRLILGFGIGNLREEFEMLGVPFEGRGPRADDALRALRSSLSRREVSYSGPYYEYSGLVIEPHAVQAHVPIWVGGHTRRALRRAVELGDGWLPTPTRTSKLTVSAIAEMLASVDVPSGFEVVVTPESPLDPLGDPEQVIDALGQLSRVGTILNVHVIHQSLAHYLEQIEGVSELVLAINGSARNPAEQKPRAERDRHTR